MPDLSFLITVQLRVERIPSSCVGSSLTFAG